MIARPVCWLARRIEILTGTTWPQWPYLAQRVLLFLTRY
jgi:hypothetical protein